MKKGKTTETCTAQGYRRPSLTTAGPVEKLTGGPGTYTKETNAFHAK